jgi:hypothetical protein
VNLTPDQWRRRLTPQQFRVLREAATERAYTSPLNDEHRRGTFLCAGCDLPSIARRQVRQRHRLAELYPADRRCGAHALRIMYCW